MRRVRRALADLTDGIRWRALAAAWVLTLVAVATLTATNAPVITTAIVLAGAAAVIALAVAGETLARSDDADVFEAMASFAGELRAQTLKTETLPSELLSSRIQRARAESDEQERRRPSPPPRMPRTAEPDPQPRPESRDSKQILADNVRRLRREQRLSVEQLAAAAALHPTEVSRLERALREPRLRVVMQIAAALDVPVQELIAPAEEWEREDAPALPPPES
jgi:ribosome-binding protein aMBF1 (putative translation factor)